MPVRTYLEFEDVSKAIIISSTKKRNGIWMLPSSESPWSAFPWFLQLLARVATMVATEIASHQQVLAGAERVSQVGEPGVGIPHVL